MASKVPVILDTCALLWLATSDKKLSATARKDINEAAFVYVSAISSFEIALKSARGKLDLKKPTQEWFERVVESHSLTVLPVDVEICIASAESPRFHEDPADRIIIATAKLNNLSVITDDERFPDYGVKVKC
jgi:PIN domain nuclease of toxin-antitoxin system